MNLENVKIFRHPVIRQEIERRNIRFDVQEHIFKRTEPSIQVSSPWVLENTGNEPCTWCSKVLWGYFGLLPSCALECYKIVVRPRTVVELMKLHELQKRMKLSCKCGPEPREEVNANYGGYFYTRGIDQGRMVKRIVVESVHSEIHQDIPVFLKRACTEYEYKYGPSDKWQLQPGQEQFEKKLETLFDESFRMTGATQPEELKREIMDSWCYFAHSRGDMSYLELTGGRYLYPQYVLYD